ncbi:MAG: hypothetical protein ABR987_12905 [Terracidiphilus sp.]
MASQTLNELHRESPQPFMLRDVLPGPGWAPYWAPARPLPGAADFASKACEEDGSCVKGLVVAICLEGAAALSVFGIWQLWHLIR